MTLLNLAPANFNHDSTLYSSNIGKVGDHGCNGTVCNVTAAEGIFVNTPGKIQAGGGYSFTDTFPSKLIGQNPGYSIVDKYSDNDLVVRPGNVVAHWKNLTGGKRTHRRRHSFRQVGCKSKSKRRNHKHKHTQKCRHSRRKNHINRRKHRNYRMTRRHRHRGGNGQPYSNIPLSFGQSFDSKLSAYDSALANPTPLTPYNRCESVSRTL